MTDENNIYYGRVQYFCIDKGYGQICGNDNEVVFLHRAEIVNGVENPSKGQAVSYCKKIEPGKSRNRAINVRPLG
jgi:cold shock CspA family protein